MGFKGVGFRVEESWRRVEALVDVGSPPTEETQPNTKPYALTDRGACILRVGFWGILCHKYNQEPPKTVSAIL